MVKKKIFFLLSHPIQYFSPLFQLLAREDAIDLMVLYCDDYGTHKKNIHPEIGAIAGWDIPLLEGYNYKFLKNNSWKPSIFTGFFGLINLEIFKVLKNERGSYLIVHGWARATNFLAIIAAKFTGVKLCLRAENPLNQELLKPKHILFLRKIFFKYFFFKLFDYFLYIGEQNKKLYEYHGVKKEKLIFTPYAVDNDRFKAEYEKYRDQKTEIRKELELPVDKRIILTSGKYIYKKRPMDLLKAFHLLNDEKAALVFLGDGELRKEMENYIAANNLKNVYLTGFKNQSEVGKFFAAADIFVLPSGAGETWGLVVNEAMSFSLPIICSDIPGSAYDLVKENINGFIFKLGDIEQLKIKLELLLNDISLRKRFSTKSYEIIDNYTFNQINNNIIENLFLND